MHENLDAREKKNGHLFYLLLASDHHKLRTSVEPMTTYGVLGLALLKRLSHSLCEVEILCVF